MLLTVFSVIVFFDTTWYDSSITVWDTSNVMWQSFTHEHSEHTCTQWNSKADWLCSWRRLGFSIVVAAELICHDTDSSFRTLSVLNWVLKHTHTRTQPYYASNIMRYATEYKDKSVCIHNRLNITRHADATQAHTHHHLDFLQIDGSLPMVFAHPCHPAILSSFNSSALSSVHQC